MTPVQLDPTSARLYILFSAILWSLSGAFAKVLNLNGVTMAFYRALFAGIALSPVLKLQNLTFRPAMIGMIACFAPMNLCYVTAVTKTTAANAIFLQYTAPAWMFLASVLWLGEPLERHSLVSMFVGMVGILVIVLGNWQSDAFGIILALVAGASYGGVAVFLRLLRNESSIWLTVLHQLCSALVLVPVLLFRPHLASVRPNSNGSPLISLVGADPSGSAVPYIMLTGLIAFGIFQMAVPYVLFSRGLSAVTPQEAGIIALVEPVLNPVLTFLVVGERPTLVTVGGGMIILAGIMWRYAALPNNVQLDT